MEGKITLFLANVALRLRASLTPDVSQPSDLAAPEPPTPHEILSQAPCPPDGLAEDCERGRAMLAALLSEAANFYWWKLDKFPAGQALLGAEEPVRAAALFLAVQCAVATRLLEKRLRGSPANRTNNAGHELFATAIEDLNTKRTALSNAMLEEILTVAVTEDDGKWNHPIEFKEVIRMAENASRRAPLAARIKATLEAVCEAGRRTKLSSVVVFKKLLDRLHKLPVEGEEIPALRPLPTGDVWMGVIVRIIATTAGDERATWQAMVEHCRTATSARPSARWVKQAEQILARLSPSAWRAGLIDVLAAIGEANVDRPSYQSSHWEEIDPTALDDAYTDLLRGLTWTAGLVPDSQLIPALGNAAERSFQKIAKHGPRNVKVGNASLWSLTRIGSLDAAAQLSRLKSRVKHASCRKQVVKALDAVAAAAGVTLDDLRNLPCRRSA